MLGACWRDTSMEVWRKVRLVLKPVSSLRWLERKEHLKKMSGVALPLHHCYLHHSLAVHAPMRCCSSCCCGWSVESFFDHLRLRLYLDCVSYSMLIVSWLRLGFAVLRVAQELEALALPMAVKNMSLAAAKYSDMEHLKETQR
jgi:hypothetical protein